MVAYRESGRLVFLPEAAATAQEYAIRNAGFLTGRGIGVSVSQIRIDARAQVMFVSVSMDLSSLLPSFLQHRGAYKVTGFAWAPMQVNP